MHLNQKSLAGILGLGMFLAVVTGIAAPKMRESTGAEKLKELAKTYKRELGEKSGPLTKELDALGRKEADLNKRVAAGLDAEAAKAEREALIREQGVAAQRIADSVAATTKRKTANVYQKLKEGGFRESVFWGSDKEVADQTDRAKKALESTMEPITRIAGPIINNPEKMAKIENNLNNTISRMIALGKSDKEIETAMKHYKEALLNAEKIDAQRAKDGTNGEPVGEGGKALSDLGDHGGSAGKAGRATATKASEASAVEVVAEVISLLALEKNAPEGGSEALTDPAFVSSAEVRRGIKMANKEFELALSKSGDAELAKEAVYKWLKGKGLKEEELSLLCTTGGKPGKCAIGSCKKPGA